MITVIAFATGFLLLGLVAAVYSACVLAGKTDQLIRETHTDGSLGP